MLVNALLVGRSSRAWPDKVFLIARIGLLLAVRQESEGHCDVYLKKGAEHLPNGVQIGYLIGTFSKPIPNAGKRTEGRAKWALLTDFNEVYDDDCVWAIVHRDTIVLNERPLVRRCHPNRP